MRLNKEAGNQNLHFAAEIWKCDSNIPPSKKKEDVQTCTSDGFPFLYTNMTWYPKGDIQFGIFGKKGQTLKYVRKCSTHTPGTLYAIPSGVLKRLAKLTSQNPDLHYKLVESIYLYQAKEICGVVLAPCDDLISVSTSQVLT